MNLKTKTQLAARVKKSKPYIDKESRRDPPVIDLVNDGKTASGKIRWKVDFDGPLTQAFIKRRLGYLPTSEQPKKPRKKAHQPEPPAPPPKTQAEPPTPPLRTGNNPTGLPGHTGTEEEINLKDENLELKNEKLRIEIGQNRTKLIEKALVVSVFGQLDSIDENQLKALAVRVGPKIEESLAETYDEKTKEILQLLGREDDTHLKADIQKIMNSGGSDRVRKFTEIIEEDTGKILKNIQRVFDKFLENVEI